MLSICVCYFTKVVNKANTSVVAIVTNFRQKQCISNLAILKHININLKRATRKPSVKI